MRTGGSGIRSVKHLSLNSACCVSFMERCFHSKKEWTESFFSEHTIRSNARFKKHLLKDWLYKDGSW